MTVVLDTEDTPLNVVEWSPFNHSERWHRLPLFDRTSIVEALQHCKSPAVPTCSPAVPPTCGTIATTYRPPARTSRLTGFPPGCRWGRRSTGRARPWAPIPSARSSGLRRRAKTFGRSKTCSRIDHIAEHWDSSWIGQPNLNSENGAIQNYHKLPEWEAN